MRRALALLLILGLAPGTCVYQAGTRWRDRGTLTFTPIALPPAAESEKLLGAFALEKAWSLTATFSGFGSYSALAPLPDGRLLAVGDFGRYLIFSPPGSARAPLREGNFIPRSVDGKANRDVEAITRDPASGTIWSAREGLNAIARHDAGFRLRGTARPQAMRAWPENGGPEALARLADGRFVVLAEGYDGLTERRRHEAVIFASDPVQRGAATRFTFEGAEGFSPTDMAQLPDGRVLILMRRLVWPFPLRFEGRIMMADPAAIRPGRIWRGTVVARLDAPLPVDNFEGMAIEPRSDGRVTVWLISDQNGAATQRTMLWKLVVDPARLPKAPRSQARQ